MITKFWVKIFAFDLCARGCDRACAAVWVRDQLGGYSRMSETFSEALLERKGSSRFSWKRDFWGVMSSDGQGQCRNAQFFHHLRVLGAHFSAIWIVVANSWMQTPAGYKIVGRGTEGQKPSSPIFGRWSSTLLLSTASSMSSSAAG